MLPPATDGFGTQKTAQPRRRSGRPFRSARRSPSPSGGATRIGGNRHGLWACAADGGSLTEIAERGPITAQWPRLFDETLAALRVKAGKDDLTLSEALNRLSDPKAARRQAAAEGLNQALAERVPTLALVLNTVAVDKVMEERWRGFKRPADSRHLGNEVHGEAVDAMAQAVADAYPRLSHRYYALKARAMGKATLDQWDRNAPIETTAPRGLPAGV